MDVVEYALESRLVLQSALTFRHLQEAKGPPQSRVPRTAVSP